MTVFLLMRDVHHESHDLVAIYDNAKAANSHKAALDAKPHPSDFRYDVEVHEIRSEYP